MSTGSRSRSAPRSSPAHRRSYVRGDVVYDPLHYLSLLEKKPGALDQAAPLRGWNLDPAFDTLRRLLEARFGPRGKREYIQVLRLHEDFPEPQVAAAVSANPCCKSAASSQCRTPRRGPDSPSTAFVPPTAAGPWPRRCTP